MTDLIALPPEQQLDFWLGTWDATWGDDQHGTNTITRILNERVIQEQFDAAPASAFRGLSLSVYVAKLKRWRQTWVDDTGSYWDFLGTVSPDEFIFATDDLIDDQPVKLRMIFFHITADHFDWRWERSDDGGTTWKVNWLIHYQRRDAK